MIKKDGHIHTPFCPHGTSDSLSSYVERAIELGFSHITFTEHAPLPLGFIDPTPNQDSAMSMEALSNYLHTLELLKREYQKVIHIEIGLEVDYITGYEDEIKAFLDEYGPRLDDSILSVHFLQSKSGYYCLDYSPKMFQDFIDDVGSITRAYQLYYQTILEAITSNLGPFKPKRLGHLTLIHKFQKLFPESHSHLDKILIILHEMKRRKMELDVNVAGLHKEYCQEIYPPKSILKLAQNENIPLVYGSDAHSAKDVGLAYEQIEAFL